MIGEVPIVTFDTSAHNRLADDLRFSDLIVDQMRAQSLWFRFTGLAIGELVATTDPARRDKLLDSCRKIQGAGPSECLLLSHSMIQEMVASFSSDPKAFDWKTVNVRWPDCERAINRTGCFFDDKVSKDERDFHRERKVIGERERERQRVELRPKIQGIFAAHGELPPDTFEEAIKRLENAGGAAIVTAAHKFYSRVKKDSDEATAKQFMDVCPPFKALVYASIFIPWYDSAVRDPSSEGMTAGSNDLFMATYLPYCDKFVTAEVNRQQEKCLRAVVSAIGLGTEVLSYDDFRKGYPVAA